MDSYRHDERRCGRLLPYRCPVSPKEEADFLETGGRALAVRRHALLMRRQSHQLALGTSVRRYLR